MFRLDLRSLAVMRIILGILSIINIIVICNNFEAFVSDYGIFPASTALSQYPMLNYRWFHVISGSYRWQIPLFMCHCIIALSFTVWYRTRASTIALWIFTCSLQWSQHIFLHGWDTVMRILLFRSMFLPLWEWYSVDSLKKIERKLYISSVSSFALIIQIACIYITSAALKTDYSRTYDHTAIYYSLWIDYYTSNLWIRLRSFSKPLEYITTYIYYLEWIWPAIYLIPQRKLKISICLLFISFHLALALFMELWLFPRICICAWIWLLPHRYNDNINTKSYYQRNNNSESLAAIWIALILIRNINTVFPNFLWNVKLERYYYLLRLDQNRWMFAPSPSFSNGRHQIDGIYFNNNRVNLSNPLSLPYSGKPNHDKIIWILPNSKRTRVWLTLNNNSYAYLRANRALHLCKKWNNKHNPEDRLKSVQMQYHRQNTLTGYEYGETQTNNRWTRDCPR